MDLQKIRYRLSSPRVAGEELALLATKQESEDGIAN